MSVCGTPQHYWAGCREPECRAAHREYERERIRRKNARAGLVFATRSAPVKRVRAVRQWDSFTMEEIRRVRGMDA